ncbi:MAG: hypothetical protein A3J07_04215 [Candidatus Doudnabacteria bacterium RIFCSPLOWO2_02_FULL_49_13]|uniref:PAS fold-4 domain-containing protein n=1 Tax=Candidatus Doudnabacteria bacterium RIFCSPHIGHO2_12_FULL_48_16 TaxID=1817838 RepID=A0A1F5PJT4_9BACT|nr:MAG: hypothetical protein A3B77_03020 [Candidatus Doudnabacteria bacterium RIFCSPHIGHO2_02_FULL_49_24]OGE90119.1 MAG: hypothetical protein A3E29_03355 [Candidatus Doudnabacteria bacterium RIFCSPHIGHO2_12_FULL_48_16]OGF03262.1 MAG: hypothetical protein A3J07_04215 [Candidatus Doudnabacteria bacterium RIFCSPLOWO2_02_FULL_49_13]
MKKIEHKQNGLKESKDLAMHYMKTLVDVARESFLILDSDLEVISGNSVFYQTFQASPKQTENTSLYKLGNGQWDIPELKKLMEDILPSKKTVKDYKVVYNFETIGRKTMVLNARQIDSVQLIILAIEDITVKQELEEKLAKHAEELAVKVEERTKELSDKVKELEKSNKIMVDRELKMVELKNEIANLKKRVNSGNGNHKNG